VEAAITVYPIWMYGTDDVGIVRVKEAAIALWDFRHNTSVFALNNLVRSLKAVSLKSLPAT
ncbi:hypothetical protein H6G49_29890, partial [Nostoc sp. PCC 7120 = FACHB-418]